SGELFFGSERDGYNHLYHAKLQPQAAQAATSGGPRADSETVYSMNVSVDQLTKGRWQDEWAKWAADDQIVLMSTESGYTEREFYSLSIADKQRTKLASSGKGMKGSPDIDDT